MGRDLTGNLSVSGLLSLDHEYELRRKTCYGKPSGPKFKYNHKFKLNQQQCRKANNNQKVDTPKPFKWHLQGQFTTRLRYVITTFRSDGLTIWENSPEQHDYGVQYFQDVSCQWKQQKGDVDFASSITIDTTSCINETVSTHWDLD